MYTYIHTYIHTCMHKYIYTYIHTYMHTYIHIVLSLRQPECSDSLLIARKLALSCEKNNFRS